MVAFFVKRTLLNERLARNMLGWTHSGFNVDLSVKIPASSSMAREALAQYISRSPVSLQKMLVEEHAGSVLYRSEDNPYLHTDSQLFPATEFLVEVLQQLPDPGSRLIRRYGLYSSRSRGTWSRQPHLARLAPEGWQKKHQEQPALHLGTASQDTPDQSVSLNESRSPGRDCSQKCTKLTPCAVPAAVPRCGSLPSLPIPSRSSGSSATSSKPARLQRGCTRPRTKAKSARS